MILPFVSIYPLDTELALFNSTDLSSPLNNAMYNISETISVYARLSVSDVTSSMYGMLLSNAVVSYSLYNVSNMEVLQTGMFTDLGSGKYMLLFTHPCLVIFNYRFPQF